MDIRHATEDDLADIVAIYNATVPSRMVTADTEPVSVESRRGWLREHTGRRPLWVVADEVGVAAWLSFSSFYGRPAYDATAEVSIYVGERVRRRGLGRLLLSQAIEQSSSLGVTTLLGFIFGHNEPSLRLFADFGFARWGTLPGVARLDGVARDLVIVGRRAAPE
jgi:phosphinothricin acetyltransferase